MIVDLVDYFLRENFELYKTSFYEQTTNKIIFIKVF